MGEVQAGIGGTGSACHAEGDIVAASVAQLLGDGVIGIEYQTAGMGHGFGDLSQDNIRVAIAHHLIPEQIVHQEHIQRDLGKDNGGKAFVHFQHHEVTADPTAQGTVFQQGGGNTGSQIGALGVVDDGIAILPEDMGHQVLGGGFSVGTGHSDDLSIKLHLLQERVVQSEGNTTGQGGGASDEFTGKPHQPSQNYGKSKSHAVSLPFQNSFQLHFPGSDNFFIISPTRADCKPKARSLRTKPTV